MRRTIKVISLLLILALCGLPAGAAGFLDWLIGGDEAEEASTQVTLPPAEDVMATTGQGTVPPLETVAPAPLPTATLAPIPAASIEDDGLVRVALQSLGAPRTLNLTLSGIYAVDGDPGFRFARGTRVALSEGNGRVYLAVGGLTLDMGTALTLTRHRAGEGKENGIYIDESEKDALFAGDLTVSADNGALRAVLKLPVEEYLLGVVAYEMSDSFPLEALKAQAVAARTYALQRKWQSAGKAWDLVDTTADQVYKGYRAEYRNVAEAVKATEGVVGLYNGTFATCYYSASNGGQTALASQSLGNADNDGYLAMADDPYDLENPKSLVNSLTVSAACEGSAALKGMLEAALGEAMATEGYDDGEWRLDGIEAIEPVNPLFEGSRQYQGLRFSLKVSVLEPVATPEPSETPEATETPTAEPTAEPSEAPAVEVDAMPTAPDEPLPEPTEAPREWVSLEDARTVTLDVYERLKPELSLGLNNRDYETVDVETETGEDGAATAFTISLRRYGHGVGMSQRGAQWMASAYGKNWQEILRFYYPGLSLEKMAWPTDTLTDLAALPDSVGAARPKPTPTPTPAPLPALKEGERYAVVTATSLNLRKQPSTSAMALDQLAQGRRLIVRGEADADGWVAVKTAELEGYVKAEYLRFE